MSILKIISNSLIGFHRKQLNYLKIASDTIAIILNGCVQSFIKNLICNYECVSIFLIFHLIVTQYY